MRSITLAFVLIFSTTMSSFCQSNPEGGLLWKISGNGLSQPSYLFGTWHGTYDILDSFLDTIPGMHTAFDACTQFVGEVGTNTTDSAAIEDAKKKMLVLLPKDSTYAVLLNKTDILFLDSVLTERIGTVSAEVNLAPSQLSMVLMQISKIKKMEEKGLSKKQLDSLQMKVIDEALTLRAKEKGYTIQRFETVAEQLDMLFPPISLQKAAILLIRGLREDNPAILEELDAAYRSQDLRKIAAFEENLKASIADPERQKEYDDTMDLLLRKRNQAWIEKIPSFIKDKPSFIGVGVRHLPGKTGLICLLQEKGYTVEPVR